MGNFEVSFFTTVDVYQNSYQNMCNTEAFVGLCCRFAILM